VSAKEIRSDLIHVRQVVPEYVADQLDARSAHDSLPPLWLVFWSGRMEFLIGYQCNQGGCRGLNGEIVRQSLEDLVAGGRPIYDSDRGRASIDLWHWRKALGRLPTAIEWRAWLVQAEKGRNYPQDHESRVMRPRVIVDAVAEAKADPVTQTPADLEERGIRPWPVRLEQPIPLPEDA
jgi:hypothetical protein